MKMSYLRILPLLFLLLPLVALADGGQIGGGKKGGAYDTWAKRSAQILKNRYDLQLQPVNKGGATGNIRCVTSNECAMGFTQTDALALSGEAESVEIVGALGMECAFLVGTSKGRVTDEDHLQSVEDPAISVAVGGKGSGSQATWDYMVQLEEDYGRSKPVYKGGNRSLAQLKSGKIDAMLFVTSPESTNVKKHTLIQAVVKDDSLEFIDVNDGDLNDKLPTGEAIYTFEKVKIPGRFTRVETICTPVIAIANVDLEEDTLDAMAGLFLGANLAALTK